MGEYILPNNSYNKIIQILFNSKYYLTTKSKTK